MKHPITSLLAASLILMNASVFSHQGKQTNPLLGSWEMLEVHWVSENERHSINKTQPGLFLFTHTSYSIMWTPTQGPRKPFKILAKPTNEEMMSGFKSVVFNGGNYEFTDTTVTTTAFIAKVPGFEGGIQHYEYTINNNVLTITMVDETYPNGTKPDWSGKWKTEFILKRVE